MTLYLVVFFLLWVGLLITALHGKPLLSLDIFALAIFVLLAGQRFETGNDWLVYRDHYRALQDFGLFSPESQEFPEFEPLYTLLAWTVGAVLDFQEFLLLTALFNGIVLFRFANAWRVSFVGVFAIYYAWLYLPVQMAMTRYSLAMSFALIALTALMKGRRRLAYALLFVAAGFHVFSLALLPLFFLFRRDPSARKMLLVSAAVCVAMHVTLVAMSAGLFSWLPFVEKLAFYYDGSKVSSPSAGSVGYILLNLLFFIWTARARGPDVQSRVERWSVLYLLIFQVALWTLPVFWNRIQAFVVAIQACVLSRYLIDRRSVAVFVAGCAISIAVLLKVLVDPAFISYLPYQSYWVDKVFMGAERDDGEERFREALDIHRERNVK